MRNDRVVWEGDGVLGEARGEGVLGEGRGDVVFGEEKAGRGRQCSLSEV